MNETEETFGKKLHGADATFFTSNAGRDGFCDAKVLKFRMKGRVFHWARVGSCKPSGDGYFEIRVKHGQSPLIPPAPNGINHIFCEVDPAVPDGTVIQYSLYQVRFEDGKRSEKELHDPELEITF
jgi:hypothetical protein